MKTEGNMATTVRRSLSLRLLIPVAMLVLLPACTGSGEEGSVEEEASAETASTETDGASEENTDLDTLEPGVITVAIRGDLPFAAVGQDGELTGVDGDIMSALAERLGLDLQIETMDFSGQLGAIESGRVDVAIGSIGWSAERAEAGLFTDPAYYAGPTIVQSEDSDLSTFADLEGKTIGTVTGYAWVPAINEIPGAELRTYESADAVYLDVGTGRIDAGFIDTLQDIYTATVRTDLGIKTVPLDITQEQIEQNEAFSIFDKIQFPFFVPEQGAGVEAALTDELRAMYESGDLAEILNEWKLDPELFLTPGESATRRVGVDRPEGWEPPSI